MTNKQQETLILLHGFTGSGQSWQSFTPALSKQFRVITPDIVGHGKAASPAEIAPYQMTHAAKTIVTSVKEPFHLLGYSMGGRLALHIALYFPQKVKSLILESAAPGLKIEAEREARKKRDNALADKIEANGIEWFAEYWESISLWNSQSAELKAQLRLERLKNNPAGLANSLRGMGTGVMPSLWGKLYTLAMPVKLIVGELDTKFVGINHEMADLIPNVDLSIVEAAGHRVHLEKPEEFLQLVQDFLINDS